jgi:hypothetical protein
MRLSAILGTFAELRQLLPSAEAERSWLFRPLKGAPFDGRPPIQVLSGPFERQLAVRRYLLGIVLGQAPPNEIDVDFAPYTDDDLIWK